MWARSCQNSHHIIFRIDFKWETFNLVWPQHESVLDVFVTAQRALSRL